MESVNSIVWSSGANILLDFVKEHDRPKQYIIKNNLRTCPLNNHFKMDICISDWKSSHIIASHHGISRMKL